MFLDNKGNSIRTYKSRICDFRLSTGKVFILQTLKAQMGSNVSQL